MSELSPSPASRCRSQERGHLARLSEDAGKTPALLSEEPNAFTLLEMLVATAVFAMLMMIVLQMTSGLMSGASRMDENLKMEQDVRLFFDLLRRDLAQARIGTKQNQFYGTGTTLTFVSSTQRLKTNYVSDQRLVTYFLRSNAILRAVVDPTIDYYPNTWDPTVPYWWTSSGFRNYVENTNEAVLTNVFTTNSEIFGYYLPNETTPTNNATNAATPPRGVKVNFFLAGKRAVATGQTNADKLTQIEYDVDLNIPPVFNP